MELIAGEVDLKSFAEQSAAETAGVEHPVAHGRITPALRGVLAETATTGLVRYEWQLLRPLVLALMDQVLADFEAESAVEVGPPAPLAGGETPAAVRVRLRAAVQGFQAEAPFTLQRLAELLLEPRKQYTHLDKLAQALEKVLWVTSTVTPAPEPGPRPALADLAPVNDNPAPVPSGPGQPPGVAGPASNGPLSPGSTAGYGLVRSLFGPMQAKAVGEGSGGEGGQHWEGGPHGSGVSTVDEPWPSSSGPLITLPSGEPLPIAPGGGLHHLPLSDTAERMSLGLGTEAMPLGHVHHGVEELRPGESAFPAERQEDAQGDHHTALNNTGAAG